MKITNGSSYLTRNGLAVTVAGRDDEWYPWQGTNNGQTGRTWTITGKYCLGSGKGESDFDLVEEILEKETGPQKHCELIKLWADGAEIEFWSNAISNWQAIEVPNWVANTKYRVKPLPVPNVVMWHAVNASGIGGGWKTKSGAIFAASTSILLRIELSYADPLNPLLVSATLEKP